VTIPTAHGQTARPRFLLRTDPASEKLGITSLSLLRNGSPVEASCSMTEILSAVSPSVFSWSVLGRGSSAAYLLPRPEKGVLWPTPCWTRPAREAVVALVLTGLVDISSQCRTEGPREATCHPPKSQQWKNARWNWFFEFIYWIYAEGKERSLIKAFLGIRHTMFSIKKWKTSCLSR